jgi:hypothetical protein
MPRQPGQSRWISLNTWSRHACSPSPSSSRDGGDHTTQFIGTGVCIDMGLARRPSLRGRSIVSPGNTRRFPGRPSQQPFEFSGFLATSCPGSQCSDRAISDLTEIWLTNDIALQHKGFPPLGLSRRAGMARCRAIFPISLPDHAVQHRRHGEWNGPAGGFPQTDQNPRGING